MGEGEMGGEGKGEAERMCKRINTCTCITEIVQCYHTCNCITIFGPARIKPMAVLPATGYY